MENYTTETLEELDQLYKEKMQTYLDMEPVIRPKKDRMLKYEEKLCAEKGLYTLLRQLNTYLDIILKED